MNKAPFFLLSFLPALAYWGLEYYYPPQIALMGGVLLAVIEISAEKFFMGEVHRFSLLNFFLILTLGSLALVAEDGVWFKLQPAFSSAAMIGVLGFYKLKKRSLMFEILSDLKQKSVLPEYFFLQFEKHLIIFFILHGILMTVAAISFETGVWLFLKTAGFYILMVLFVVFEVLWFRFVGLRNR